jgi:hypothetical protein
MARLPIANPDHRIVIERSGWLNDEYLVHDVWLARGPASLRPSKARGELTDTQE